MLQQIFLKLLEMSVAAGYCAIFVIVVRLFMKKLPKSYSYVLWVVVFIRLLLPVLPETSWSLVPDVGALKEDVQNMENIAGEKSDMDYSGDVTWESNVENKQDAVGGIPTTGQTNGDFLKEEIQLGESFGGEKENYSAEPEKKINFIRRFSVVWLLGLLVFFIYGVISHISLARRLKRAWQCENSIYELQGLPTAFVVGVIKPRIYLPAGLSEEYRHYVVAHEQTHVQRGDLVVKYITYVLVCIHWFNPLMWISCCLMCRDMEMSCDERVLRSLGMEEKKAYSAALLAVASGRKVQLGLPIAFSESNAKKRIVNVLNYKKPSFWAGLVIGAGLLVLVIGLLSDPESEREGNDIVTEAEESTEERDTKILAEKEIPAQREAIMRNDISNRQVLSEKLSQEFNIGFLYSDYEDVSKTEMDQFHFNAILFDRMDKENFDEDITYYFDGQNLMEQFCIMTGQEEEAFLKLNEGYDLGKQYFTIDGDDTCAYVTVYDTHWNGDQVEIFYECWAEHGGQHLWDGKMTMRADKYYMKFVANERDMKEVLAEVSGQSPIAHYRQNIMETELLESYEVPAEAVEYHVEALARSKNVNFSVTLNQRDDEYFYGVIECWNKRSPQFTDECAIYVRYSINTGILEALATISLEGAANVGAPVLSQNKLFWKIEYLSKVKNESYQYDLKTRWLECVLYAEGEDVDNDYESNVPRELKTILFPENKEVAKLQVVDTETGLTTEIDIDEPAGVAYLDNNGYLMYKSYVPYYDASYLKNIWLQDLKTGKAQQLKGIRNARLIKGNKNFILLDDNEVEIIDMQEKLHAVYAMPNEMRSSAYVSGEYLIFQGADGYISSINVNNIAK
jgi:beta-lactamase regulating signal transducer with metallopeptidase domain